MQALGEELGVLFSVLYTEVRSLIPFVYERNLEEMTIRLELFLEAYNLFDCKINEDGMAPAAEELRELLYWYVSDYSDITEEKKVKELVVAEGNFCVKLLKEADLSNPDYLYYYGEYVSENELETAAFMASLPQETIDIMADTYTEGYRIGFELGNKDLSKKKTTEIRYALGFERMVLKAIENLKKLGLEPVVRRTPMGILQGAGLFKLGAIGANPNKQYDFDHKDDKALIWDKGLMQRKLEVLRSAYETYKEDAYLYEAIKIKKRKD